MQKEIVLVDSNEKKELIFPKMLWTYHGERKKLVQIETRRKRLVSGDYCLASDPRGTLVERKGSLREIWNNTNTSDKKRFLSALDRLTKDSDHPILVMEGSPAVLLRPTNHVPEPWKAIDRLNLYLHERGIELLLLPTSTIAGRRAAGEWVLRRMLANKAGKCNG